MRPCGEEPPRHKNLLDDTVNRAAPQHRPCTPEKDAEDFRWEPKEGVTPEATWIRCMADIPGLRADLVPWRLSGIGRASLSGQMESAWRETASHSQQAFRPLLPRALDGCQIDFICGGIKC